MLFPSRCSTSRDTCRSVSFDSYQGDPSSSGEVDVNTNDGVDSRSWIESCQYHDHCINRFDVALVSIPHPE